MCVVSVRNKGGALPPASDRFNSSDSFRPSVPADQPSAGTEHPDFNPPVNDE